MAHPWADLSSPLKQDFAHCAALIAQGSRTFHAASMLLPQHVRMPAFAIYAFCRLSDDAVDGEEGQKGDRAAIIHRLKSKLDDAYSGVAQDDAADRAFAYVIERFQIPKTLPSALIDGLAFDAAGGECQTLSDLHAYSARVASSVGAMMTVLMGVREKLVLARACDLGVAMQFSNIARDVGEDARNGRLYLPNDWLAEVGIDRAAWLENPVFDERIGRLVQRLLGLAETLYTRSAGGIAGLPMVCRPAMHAARIIYREIGREVARRGYNSVDSRAVISGRRKIALLPGAIAASVVFNRMSQDQALAETEFLVAAVPACGYATNPWTGPIDERIGRILEIFGKMNERERQVHS